MTMMFPATLSPSNRSMIKPIWRWPKPTISVSRAPTPNLPGKSSTVPYLSQVGRIDRTLRSYRVGYHPQEFAHASSFLGDRNSHPDSDGDGIARPANRDMIAEVRFLTASVRAMHIQRLQQYWN
jgi:hypothetical protein